MPVQPCYRPDIDGLRALAILPVVVFHYFPRYAPGGFVGVDIFFVISGYLISLIIFRNLSRDSFSFTEFYAHRIRRIFPALILVLIACYGLGWVTLLPDEFKLLGKHIAAGAGFVQNIVLQREAGYFDVASELKPLLHLWSLSVEEQFYLVYPLFVWLLWRVRLNLLTAIFLITLISLVLAHRGVDTDAVKTFFWVHTRFWELMAGALLAYGQVFRTWSALFPGQFKHVVFSDVLARFWQLVVLRNLAAGVGLGLIVLSIACYQAKTPWPGLHALVPVGGAMLLIAAGPTAWINRIVLSAKPLVWIGLISYPLYLWHWPLLSFMRIVEVNWLPRGWRIAAVLVSFGLATLTYWCVEKPIRYGARRVWKNAALCFGLAVTGLVGLHSYKYDGFGFRVKEISENLAVFDPENGPGHPKNQDAFCKVRFPFSEKEHVYCRLSADAAPSILILGDSHGASLYPGLISVLSKRHEVVAYIGAGGCLPFMETLSFNRNKVLTELDKVRCRKRINQALDVAKGENIKTVLLVSRGPLYLSGKGFALDDLEDEKSYNWKILYHLRPELTNPVAIWEAAMRATLSELSAEGKHLIFVLDNPELGFHPKSCIDARPLRLTSHVRTPCAVPRAVFEERNRSYRALVTKVLKDFPQVVLVDGAKPLCDNQWCWAIKDGKVLYYDDDHLAPEGARLIAREIFPHLDGLALLH